VAAGRHTQQSLSCSHARASRAMTGSRACTTERFALHGQCVLWNTSAEPARATRESVEPAAEPLSLHFRVRAHFYSLLSHAPAFVLAACACGCQPWSHFRVIESNDVKDACESRDTFSAPQQQSLRLDQATMSGQRVFQHPALASRMQTSVTQLCSTGAASSCQTARHAGGSTRPQAAAAHTTG
jgi:hypothetical protein